MENTLPTKFGLLEEREPKLKDYRVGGISGADREVIREDGDYRKFLPTIEYQIGNYFDTKACVTFSALNCLETLAIIKNWQFFNRSDRFTAKMSGTTEEGNYLSIVADSIAINHGTVDEASWEYPRDQRRPIFEWNDFYSEIPETIKMEGRKFLIEYKVRHEWVPLSQLREMLKFGPIQVTVQAWPKPNAQGIYENREGSKSYNHAVMLVYMGDDYCEIYDHYSKSSKKLTPNYKFGIAKRFTIKKIDPNSTQPTPMITLPNNCFVQLVEGNGGFALHIDGKLLIDELDKVQASWIMRSSDFSNKRAVTQEQWDSFKHFTLKMEPLN